MAGLENKSVTGPRGLGLISCMDWDQKCVTFTSAISSEHSWLHPKNTSPPKTVCLPSLLGYLHGTRADSDLQHEPQVMERSQHVLAFWGGGGRKRREEEERFFSKQPIACHSHRGEGQTEGSLGGTANRKVSLWHLEASNLIRGPQRQNLRTELVGVGGVWDIPLKSSAAVNRAPIKTNWYLESWSEPLRLLSALVEDTTEIDEVYE